MGKVKKSDAGIVCILANYKTSEMRKVLDFKITSGYPTVTIPKDFTVSIPQLSQTVQGYQHITIPPDLQVHLTGHHKPKIWGDDMRDLVAEDGRLKEDYIKVLTVVFPPISNFPVFTDRSYAGGGLMIGFQQLPHWNDNTSFVLEIFAQKTNQVQIPSSEHYEGDQGSYMPWSYASMGKTYDEPFRQGNFFIRPFAITNHEPKPMNEMKVYFGSF